MLYIAIETQRKDNIGTILRCATAFGAQALIIVGSNKVGTHGAHGAQNRIRIIHFYYWSDAVVFLKAQNCSLHTLLSRPAEHACVDIADTVLTNNFALLIRARGEATEEMRNIADHCIYVKFPGDDRAAEKVKMEVKLSICLHQYRFSQPAVENTFSGEKFDVIDIDKKELHLHSTCHVEGGDDRIDDTGVMATLLYEDGDY